MNPEIRHDLVMAFAQIELMRQNATRLKKDQKEITQEVIKHALMNDELLNKYVMLQVNAVRNVMINQFQ